MVQLPIWIFYKFQSFHNDQPTSLKSAFFEPQYILNISALYSHWQIWIPCLKFLSLEKSRSNCKVVKDYSQVSPWLSGKQNCNRLERQWNRKWRAKTQGCINLIILKYWDITQYQVQCFKHKTLKKKNRWGKRQKKQNKYDMFFWKSFKCYKYWQKNTIFPRVHSKNSHNISLNIREDSLCCVQSNTKKKNPQK